MIQTGLGTCLKSDSHVTKAGLTKSKCTQLRTATHVAGHTTKVSINPFTWAPQEVSAHNKVRLSLMPCAQPNKSPTFDAKYMQSNVSFNKESKSHFFQKLQLVTNNCPECCGTFSDCVRWAELIIFVAALWAKWN